MTPGDVRATFSKQFRTATSIGPGYSHAIAEYLRGHTDDLPVSLVPGLFQALPAGISIPLLFRYMYLGFLLGARRDLPSLKTNYSQISHQMMSMAAPMMRASDLPAAVMSFRRARGQASWRLNKMLTPLQIGEIRLGTMKGLAEALEENPLPPHWVIEGIRQVRALWPFSYGKFIDYLRDGMWP